MSERDISEIMRLLGTAIKGINELKTNFTEVKAEIADVKSELKAEIADVKSELKTDLHNFRSEVNLRFDRVEDKLEKLETQNKIVTLDFMEVRVNHSRLEKRVEILEPKAA